MGKKRNTSRVFTGKSEGLENLEADLNDTGQTDVKWD